MIMSFFPIIVLMSQNTAEGDILKQALRPEIIIQSASRPLVKSSEFDTFTRQFHQDLMDDFSTEDAIIQWILSPFKDDTERGHLKAYLDTLTQDDVSDEELRKLWWSSEADIVFYDGAGLRAFLKRVRDRL
ncbi:hypothetical protein [Methylobacterium sp.]|uniref:hypothetical protein n=1 Tax=Methylobacterium sp. TaxID=409 RepID=UPI003B002D8A